MSLLKRLSQWIRRRMQKFLLVLETVRQLLTEFMNPELREPEYVRIPVEPHPTQQRRRQH